MPTGSAPALVKDVEMSKLEGRIDLAPGHLRRAALVVHEDPHAPFHSRALTAIAGPSGARLSVPLRPIGPLALEGADKEGAQVPSRSSSGS
jgi:hypothetical protein